MLYFIFKGVRSSKFAFSMSFLIIYPFIFIILLEFERVKAFDLGFTREGPQKQFFDRKE